MKQFFTGFLETPVGKLRVTTTEEAVTHVMFDERILGQTSPQPDVLKQAIKQLQEYFAGKRKVFDLPLAPEGTPFRQSVWDCLTQIDFGETRCYGDLAATLNNPKASRAVGAANGANPISIIIPCHRVIGKQGKLTGYAGGLSRKSWLLDFEGISFKP